MGVLGVGSPSRRKPTATVASRVGSNCGRLVGEAVGCGVAVMVGVVSELVLAAAVGFCSGLAGSGVSVGSVAAVGSGVADGRFTTASEAEVGVGSGRRLPAPQAARKLPRRTRQTRVIQ